MKRKTRKERREEERRILEEMDRAMAEQAAEKAEGAEQDFTQPTEREKVRKKPDDTMPEKMHCKRCKTLMENGVCPTCGFTVYMPMDEKKRNKIRLIVAGVCMAIFVVIFVISQF